MPHCFESDTADGAWRQAANTLLTGFGERLQDSRGGKTRELLHANFYISNPQERWVLSREPGINPAFAIADVLWIVAGRNDSRFINYWNPVLPRYAGRGEQYHGAYGYRLRQQFGFDQIERAFATLASNPDSRQVVLEIWDSRTDFPTDEGLPVSEDIPCNVCALLKVRKGHLDWMQVMRSNDLHLGTPHNFVQFTMLQEIVAGWLKLELGTYVHLSDSLHVYEDQIPLFSVARAAPTASNRDHLGLPKEESVVVLQKLMLLGEELTTTDLSKEKFKDICADSELPEGYRNLILIMAADSARRRKWNAEMDYAASRCTNPVLQVAWDRWNLRFTRHAGT